ncbi:unnamed protein product, partial [Mesorhabditis belari]|uniref:Uncharacterized protein n=1 Tax=Mesorhabditis belari TaxID=2138241 RepID=A0AAF3FIH9_9BILA
MQSLNSYKIDASYEKMFQKIRIIETIQVTLPMGSIPVSQKKAMKYSNFVDFLPNPKYLRKYSLNINNFSIFERIAARLNSKTEDTFRLILVKNTLRDEEEQILEKNLNEKFQSCKSIQLNIPIRPYLTQLSNENMELLVEYCEKWDHFTASIEPLLKFGISDRIGVAFCLKEGPSRWNSGFAAVQNFLSEKHEMNAFHEHSIEAMELLLKFFEGTVKNRLLLGKAVRRLESKACFRKTLLGRRGELFVMASVLDTNQLFVLLRCNRENIIDQP